MDTDQDEDLKRGDQIDEWADPYSDTRRAGAHDTLNDLSQREKNAFEGMTGSNFNNTNAAEPDAKRSAIDGLEKNGNPATAVNHINKFNPHQLPLDTRKQIFQIMKKGGPAGVVFGILLIILMVASPTTVALIIPHMTKQLQDTLDHGVTSLTERNTAISISQIRGQSPTSAICQRTNICKKYTSLSNRQVANFQKAAQADPRLKIETRNSVLPGRQAVTAISYDGVAISPSQYRAMTYSNASFAAAMDRVYSPRLASLHDKAAKFIQARFKSQLIDPFDANDKTDKDRQKTVNDITKNGKLADGSAKTATDDPDSAECKTQACLDDQAKNNKINDATGGISDAADDINSSDVKLINQATGSVGDKALKAIGNVLKIGPVDDACTAWGGLKATSLLAKSIRSGQMARMATIIAVTGSMLMADGVMKTDKLVPEDVSFIGNLLTQVYQKEDGTKTKAASDSFGYHWAAFGATGKADESASQYVVGVSFGGEMAGIVAGVLGILGGTAALADKTCNLVNNPLVQGGMLIAGIATLLFPPTSGFRFAEIAGTATMAAVQFLALAFLPAMIADMVAGKLIDKYTNGEDIGNIWTAGTGVLLSNSAIARGNVPLKKNQVSGYLALSQEVDQLYAQIDRETLSPFDASSPNTALGSVYSKLIPTIGSIRSNPAIGVIGSLGSMLSSINSSLTGTVLAADPAAKFNACEDPEITDLSLAADPFCNLVPGIPVEKLKEDPVTITERLLEAGHIEGENGEPLSTQYQYMVTNCMQRTTPWGSSGADSTEPRGNECLLGDSGIGTPLAGLTDGQKTDMYIHYQDQIILAGRDEGFENQTTQSSTTSTSGTNTGVDKNWGGYANGTIPLTALAKIPWPGCQTNMSLPYLAPNALTDMIALNNAFKAQFGHDIQFISCYRDMEGQLYAKRTQGSNAAAPGTSNHGWGLAVDIGPGDTGSGFRYGTTEYTWMMANAGNYGWENPPSMRQGGSLEEPWHWQYLRPAI